MSCICKMKEHFGILVFGSDIMKIIFNNIYIFNLNYRVDNFLCYTIHYKIHIESLVFSCSYMYGDLNNKKDRQ